MTNYSRGRVKEWKIVADLKGSGFEIAQRAAGSHSPIDIFAINRQAKRIVFIQSKRTKGENIDFVSPKLKQSIEKELSWLNETEWKVSFEVR